MAKNVAVLTRLAGERSDVPVSPLPDVQPPESFAPKPMSPPATRRMGATKARSPPVNVSVTHP